MHNFDHHAKYIYMHASCAVMVLNVLCQYCITFINILSQERGYSMHTTQRNFSQLDYPGGSYYSRVVSFSLGKIGHSQTVP